MIFVLWVLSLFLLLPAKASAQADSIAVPFDSAQFLWDVGPGYAEGFGPEAHVITCGPYTKRVEMPATSARVKDVVPSVGSYTCTLYGVNRFGKSAEPDPAFPVFEAGTRPFPPVNMRLEVR